MNSFVMEALNTDRDLYLPSPLHNDCVANCNTPERLKERRVA